MQAASFIPGKVASPESSLTTIQARLEALAGFPEPGLKLAGCGMHRRLPAGYAKLHRN